MITKVLSNISRALIALTATAALFYGCSHSLSRVQKSGSRAKVVIPARKGAPELPAVSKTDTAEYNSGVITIAAADGTEQYFVPTVYDKQSKESVMTVNLEDVIISVSNIRNVAERNGKVDLEFSVTLPNTMQDVQWRVDLEPVLCMGQDTATLSRLVFSGERFMQKQQQDMARYEQYLRTIVDSADYFTCFGDIGGFERYMSYVEARRQELMQERKAIDSGNSSGAKINRKVPYYERALQRRGERDLAHYTTKRENLERRMTLYEHDPDNPNDTLELYLTPRFNYDPMTAYERALRNMLSDSMRLERYHIDSRNIDANLRMWTEIDTAALMRAYYNHRKIERNKEKVQNKEQVFGRIVRLPHIPNTRLDTVIRGNTSTTYRYLEQMEVNDDTPRILLFLRGNVTAMNGRQYNLPNSDTLTFSITSMTSFIDNAPRYVQRIVKRDAEASARFFFVFNKGKADLNADVADNRAQLESIKRLTQDLVTDPVFLIDSITLTATSSPEGSWNANDRLSQKRSEALRHVIEREFRQLKDSLQIFGAYALGDDGKVRRVEMTDEMPDLPKIVRAKWLAEDWQRLAALIEEDPRIDNADRILAIIESERDPDKREQLIRKNFPSAYAHIHDNLYPQLRAVDFSFSLKRRGMKQDTVWTTQLDSSYMRGVELLRKRHYEQALDLLRPYENRNTALAYMSVGLDRAACRILKQEDKRVPDDADLKYMLAVVATRTGEMALAVSSLVRAVELEPRFKFRGNLDPEIAALIKRYGLFNEDNLTSYDIPTSLDEKIN